MPVHKHANSPYYQIELYVDGHPVRGSSKTRSKKEAEAIEREWRAQKVADLEEAKRTGAGPVTVDVAFSRYWMEKGQHLVNAGTVWTDLQRMLGFFGGATRLDTITDADVANLVAWRRAHTKQGKTQTAAGEPMQLIAPATVNRSTLALLKAVFTRAKRTWRQSLPNEPNWRDHWLEEPDERVRELHEGEGDALEEAMRGDYRLWFDFVHLTGLRYSETIIKWSEVNMLAGAITTIGKGSRKVSTPITPAVKAILDQCRGHHQIWVFTYMCKRPDTPHAKAAGQVKGKRYPLTVEGAKSQWRRAKARSGVADLRLHDLRHDVATKLLRATGNLKLVQKALNHRSITTTTKYAHVLNDEVSAALEGLANSRKKSRSPLRQVG